MTLLLDFSKIRTVLDMYTGIELAEKLSMSVSLIERYQTGQIPIEEMQVADAVRLMEFSEALGIKLLNKLTRSEWEEKVKEINTLDEALMFFTHYKCPFENLEEGLAHFACIIRCVHQGIYIPWLEELTIEDLVLV